MTLLYFITITASVLSCEATNSFSVFRPTTINDEAWETEVNKTKISVGTGNQGLIDCGMACSAKGTKCPMFHYNKTIDECHLVSATTDYMDTWGMEVRTTEVYVKEGVQGK